MKKKLSILLALAVIIAAFLTVGALAAPENATAIYVGGESASDSYDGLSPEEPVATLGKVSSIISESSNSDFVVYVMADITATSSLRTWNKNVTLMSYGDKIFTITRGDDFATASDNARLGYNPALIESNGSSADSASLALYNITLDDGGKHAGEYFIQADSEGDGETVFGTENIANTSIAQDAIIATYNGVSTITLGEGTTLKNFGGMSAVRISGGELVMEAGSKIVDDEVTDRTKGETIEGADTSYYGPAGAVWLQGGTFEMENGAEIKDIVGRAIFNESGTADINGLIEGVKVDKDVWWGGVSNGNETVDGFIMHMRAGATATFESQSVVDGKHNVTRGSGIGIVSDNCELTTENGSTIKNIDYADVIYVNGTVSLNGEITGCNGGGHAINAQYGKFHLTIGSTANIHHNICSYGTIYTQSDSGVIDVYGRINDNISTDRGGAIAMANNSKNTVVNMYDGAEMCRNVSTQTGGGILVSCGTFTMNGGTISGNISGAGNVGDEDQVGGGIYIRRGGQFIMNGGEITGNYSAAEGGGINFLASDYNNSTPYVQLNGGTISGNYMNAEVTGDTTTGYTATGGESNDITVSGGSEYGKIDRYLVIDPSFSIGNGDIFMDDYNFCIERLDNVKLGNASAECENEVTDALDDPYDLNTLIDSFWYQSNVGIELVRTAPTANNYKQGEPLYAAIIETGEDGNPADGASVSFREVTVGADGRLTLDLPGNTNGYAVVLVQETKDTVLGTITITPADMVIYMGGEDGYEAVVGGSGTGSTNNSLPTPLFYVDLPTGMDADNVTFAGNGGRTWTLDVAGIDENGRTLYYIVPGANNTDPVRVTFTNSDGATVISDAFTPDGLSGLAAEYDINIYSGGAGVVTVRTDEDNFYIVSNGTGTLSVRYVVDNANKDVVVGVEPEVSETVAAGEAAITAPENTSYTFNETNVTVESDGVGLLFDDIYEDDGAADAIIDRVDEILGGSANNREYEAKYLDLVDVNNGNAWVKASNALTVYWGYPEGTDQNTDFTLLHFEGLHRGTSHLTADMVSGWDNVENVAITCGEYGISFTVEPGEFSPFVLVWGDTGSDPITPPVDPKPEPDDGDTGVGDWLDMREHDAYLSGYPDGTFRPENDMTRAEAAQMFYNLLLDKDVSSDTRFSDVPADAWYTDAVNALAALGIINGYEDGTFRPNDTITRAEFVAMSMRVADKPGSYRNPFTDVRSSAWYFEAVTGAAYYGWLEGYPDGTFKPDANITRAEVATAVNRMLERSADEDYVDENADSLVTYTDLAETHWAYYDVMEASNTHDYTKTAEENWTTHQAA